MAEDLIGQRFGKIVVIEKAPSRNGRGYWLCQCDCGKQKEIRTDNLKTGRTQSCGCLHKEALYNLNKKDLLGQKFGKLTVIKETGQRKNTRNIIWECECECGSKILVESNNLISGHTKSCGCMKSQGEYIISNILTSNNIPFEKEKTFSDCIFEDTEKKARFDFFVDGKYIIEYDGAQHFHGNGTGWFSEEAYLKTAQHDIIKNNWCKEHKIPIIRIPYSHLNKICLEDLKLDTSQYIHES